MMLSRDYPNVSIPIYFKQEIDIRANHKTKPPSATEIFRMLVCSMLDDDVIWYESNGAEIIKDRCDLIAVCKSIIKTKINKNKLIKLIYFKGYVSKCRDDFTDSKARGQLTQNMRRSHELILKKIIKNRINCNFISNTISKENKKINKFYKQVNLCST